MNLLCTFPGKFGDLLWALPTIRAISRRIGQPVDLMVAQPFSPIVCLLVQQPYIAHAWGALQWQTQDTAPISPRTPPRTPDGILANAQEDTYRYDAVIHLGYRSWPTPDVVRHTLDTYNHARSVIGTEPPYLLEEALALDEPWIAHVPTPPIHHVDRGPTIAIAFTDEHFELKLGLTIAVLERFMMTHAHARYCVLTVPNSRWSTETWTDWRSLHAGDWLEYARCLQVADVVLADCSAAHVLAVAMGKPVILMEPNPHRHNDVFYPLGKTGRVHLVTGTDGQPTFDARHTYDAVAAALTRVLEAR